jgi:hypothetical protein
MSGVKDIVVNSIVMRIIAHIHTQHILTEKIVILQTHMKRYCSEGYCYNAHDTQITKSH